MLCPCCKGEKIVDTLAKYGEFQLDVSCLYCEKTGHVSFIRWWKLVNPPETKWGIAITAVLLVISAVTGILTKNPWIYSGTICANLFLSAQLSFIYFGRKLK